MAKDRNLDSSMGWGRVLSPGNFLKKKKIQIIFSIILK